MADPTWATKNWPNPGQKILTGAYFCPTVNKRPNHLLPEYFFTQRKKFGIIKGKFSRPDRGQVWTRTQLVAICLECNKRQRWKRLKKKRVSLYSCNQGTPGLHIRNWGGNDNHAPWIPGQCWVVNSLCAQMVHGKK